MPWASRVTRCSSHLRRPATRRRCRSRPFHRSPTTQHRSAAACLPAFTDPTIDSSGELTSGGWTSSKTAGPSLTTWSAFDDLAQPVRRSPESGYERHIGLSGMTHRHLSRVSAVEIDGIDGSEREHQRRHLGQRHADRIDVAVVGCQQDQAAIGADADRRSRVVTIPCSRRRRGRRRRAGCGRRRS